VKKRKHLYTIDENVNYFSHCGEYYWGHSKNSKQEYSVPRVHMQIYTHKWNELIISERYLHAHIYCSIMHNSQDMKSTSIFPDGWMNFYY
jgi:hypothetical protein